MKKKITILVSLGLNKDRPRENTLDVYNNAFCTDFLNATESYYLAESTQFISMNTVADYMKKVETRLKEETERVQKYLHPTTQEQVKNFFFLLIQSMSHFFFFDFFFSMKSS